MTISLADKRVMVTGGSGFLGRFVCAELERRGTGEVLVPRRAEFDFTRERDVVRAYATLRPDVVIHLAAVVGGIGANRDEPGRFFYDNAMMGIQLIEQARIFGVEKFVCIGTVCAYPKHTPVPFAEDDLWVGYPEETNAPYGIAKKIQLVQLDAYRQQYGMKGVFLLPVNLYGPGDNFDLHTSHVIPAIIRKCVEARESGAATVALWGSGEPSREFLYVEDAARAIVDATERYDSSEPVNIGTGSEITIRELAHKIAEATGFEGDFTWDPGLPDGQPRRCLDTTRAFERFGFRAETSLEEGLRRTVEWYEAAENRDAARAEPQFYAPPVERIDDAGEAIAVIVRGSYFEPGPSFFSEDHYSQQVGHIRYPAGHVIVPHVHNPIERTVLDTQEAILIRDGVVRIDLYNDERQLVTSRTLVAGDIILLVGGGHGAEMLADSSIVEVKQGPYKGEHEKTRFKAAQ